MSVLLLVAGFAAVLAGALVFTNAVEWAGKRLSLGQGSVGSILAAVATALPESVIPVVAIIGGAEGATDVAIGAIVGAPFMLATVAMILVGVAALAFAGGREQGRTLDAHRPTLRRDLGVFAVLFAAALGLGLGAPRPVQYAGAAALAAAYAVYVWLTVRRGGEEADEEELRPLYFDASRDDPPRTIAIVAQLAVGIGAIVGGAHLFVEELLVLAESAGVSPLVLSLLIAPLATELPEKANSVLWVRQGKDELALGNITGAMAFQSAIPVALGLILTDWRLDAVAVLAIALALAGGVLAYFVLSVRRRFTAPALASWAALFAAFVVYVVVLA